LNAGRQFDRNLNSLWLATIGHDAFFNGDERCELRNEVIVESELLDLFLDVGTRFAVLQASPVLRHEVVDSLASPQ